MANQETETYEVFRMDKWGEPHFRVGALHAQDPGIALLTAQELYGRREGCISIWVVRQSDIYATPPEAIEEFQFSKSKTYRMANLGKQRVDKSEHDKMEHSIDDLEKGME